MLKAAHTACASTVATATPTTPQPKLITNQRSSTVLSSALTHRKYKARLAVADGAQYARGRRCICTEDEAHGVDGEVLYRVLAAGRVG